MSTVIGLFCVASGAGICVYWAVVGGRGWEGRGRELRAHVAAELLTAGLLLAGGGWMLAEGWAAQPLVAAALGALLYAVVNVAGFFAQRDERAMAAGMGAQALLCAAALAAVLAH